MVNPGSSASLPSNGILSSLPPDDWRVLQGTLVAAPLSSRAEIFHAQVQPERVYFVERGLVSVLGSTAAGQTVEVGLVGPEGALGIFALLTPGDLPFAAVVRAEGIALAVPVEVLRARLTASRAFRRLLLGYQRDRLLTTQQLIVCNRFHTASQRLARWLLMANDRVAGQPLALTQEQLAETLGVPRTWLTRAARRFQRDGFIRTRRGVVWILDRAGLAGASCECYQIVRDHTTRVPGAP